VLILTVACESAVITGGYRTLPGHGPDTARFAIVTDVGKIRCVPLLLSNLDQFSMGDSNYGTWQGAAGSDN